VVKQAVSLKEDVMTRKGLLLHLMLGSALVVLVLVACATPTATSTTTPVSPTNTPESTITASVLAYTVQVTKDIEYTRPLQPDVRAQKLDVYVPEQPDLWPVVIFVPGYGASKDTAADIVYAKELAGRGAVVFLPNWRGGMARESAKNNGVRWRQALEEIACAVRFARARAADYGGDPAWVTVVGGRSIGESLVQALVGDDSEAWDQFAAARGGPPAQVECLVSEGSAQVEAYVAWSEEPSDMDFLKDADPELWQLCSPLANLGKNPNLRVHFLRGAQDQRVGLERITAFQQAMKDAGYDVTLTALAEGEEAPPWSGPAFETLVQAILAAGRR
jgi:dienelactone hydrolase